MQGVALKLRLTPKYAYLPYLPGYIRINYFIKLFLNQTSITLPFTKS